MQLYMHYTQLFSGQEYLQAQERMFINLPEDCLFECTACRIFCRQMVSRQYGSLNAASLL